MRYQVCHSEIVRLRVECRCALRPTDETQKPYLVYFGTNVAVLHVVLIACSCIVHTVVGVLAVLVLNLWSDF